VPWENAGEDFNYISQSPELGAEQKRGSLRKLISIATASALRRIGPKQGGEMKRET